MNQDDKSLTDNLTAGHWGESQRLQRAITAVAHGLPPSDFAKPFPGTNISGLGWKELGVIGTLIGGTTLGGFALTRPSIPATTSITKPAEPLYGDFQTKEWQPDGTYKVVGTKPGRILPDGRKEIETSPGKWEPYDG